MSFSRIHFNFGVVPGALFMTPEALAEEQARRLAFQFEVNRRINQIRLESYQAKCDWIDKNFPPEALDAIDNPWD